MNNTQHIIDHFTNIIEKQMKRLESIDSQKESVDFKSIRPLIIGVVGGDGIGPYICEQAANVLRHLLKTHIDDGSVEIRNISGLTIENRAEHNIAIPDYVLAELKKCHVILKGPTTTPQAGDGWPNIESANVAMRKELDLFANVRPVKVPQEDIDWVFFRENTEGAYALGSDGININDDLAIDFTVTTTQGSERIIRAAFEYASKTGRNKVTAITKANVIKTTDGKFLRIAQEISKEYPHINYDEWYIDIMTAKLIDKNRRSGFDVMVLPNLYGDILTDEAAEFQGGVGTAGSANIGNRYAMFEAIHGSAPRMVKEGRVKYADPSSMIQAVKLLLDHTGYVKESDKLSKALDICTKYEKRISITGHEDGCTGAELTQYLIDTMDTPNLDNIWAKYEK